MPFCTRVFTFDAGHRVLGHGGKCKSLHGHTYKVEVTVNADNLDGLGMVVDFSVIKDKVGKWLDDNLDHNMILHRDDPLLREWDGFDLTGGPGAKARDLFAGKHPYVMPNGQNPTAENLADHLRVIANTILHDHRIRVTHVRVWETPNCHADSYGD